ncbi:hypothetical protein AVEN_245981-1 [Araneus ventricosus]|uniref:Fibrinogen C-terminal domain-containing protein n=1 Tax=Araneus ventricosus TaxID=182803 RepID=A0A4Y2UVC8_ARAVE|nr:hypothetical protein AVEN_245981-1 [Araneus ventricosus]
MFTDICSEAATIKVAPILQAAKDGSKNDKPMDCAELLENGVTESGVQTVYPRSRIFACKSIDVYCDMETDGGGWTISWTSIQKHHCVTLYLESKRFYFYAILTGLNGRGGKRNPAYVFAVYFHIMSCFELRFVIQ